MYGLWYITFCCLALAVIGLIVGFVLRNTANKYWELYKKTHHEANEAPDLKTYNELFEQFKKYDLLHDKYNETDWVGWITAIFAGVVAFVLTLCSILYPLEGEREANYFVAQKEYVELAVENGKDLENIAITHTIIEQNEWLANAKASKAAYGCFSKYYNVDFIDDLELIVIDREVAE